ncbi:MAG TPA: AAA family ATPase [Kofleriaceae bacterium]|nr:AAA family ATPase [Kofleriaceae bacterium]
MAVATFSGFASPLRGLSPFTEAERDVFFGRDHDRGELARMVTGEGFRAGLLYGETGVGKTSLLRAGLVPHLRDHGVIVVVCEDNAAPSESLAAGLATAGHTPNRGEAPSAFLSRAVSSALPGQQFVFVIDDADQLCFDDARIAEIADIFARVVTRSAGRARFLFSCAAEKMHALGHLEKRTGSLFPPNARYELMRMAAHDAAQTLDKVLSLAGVTADAQLCDSVIAGIGRGGPVLCADLQLAALALRELGISSSGALADAGGATELPWAWLQAACKATGNERSGLRILAELASEGAPPRSSSFVAERLGLDERWTSTALDLLDQKSVVRRAPGNDGYTIRHELLAPRVRELTAPARAAARRAYDLLGSKAASGERLSFRELRALKAEGIAPVTPEEKSVVDRSKRFYVTIAGAIAAAPIVILILIWFSMRGHYYFDVEHRAAGGRIVVKSGRPGLRSFFWLPGGFGHVVADTGLSRSMIKPDAWNDIDRHALGGSGDAWADELATILTPQLAGLTKYATGDDHAIEALRKDAKTPDDLAELLVGVQPIARGTPAEVAIVEEALDTPAPAVQQAAVAVAGAAAQRKGGVYDDTLIKALTSKDGELRHIAFTAVRKLGDERAHALFTSALSKDPDPAARRELLTEVASSVPDEKPSPSAAVSVLGSPDSSQALRDKAKDQLARSFATDPAGAAAAAAGLAADERAPAEMRVFAIGLLLDADELPTSDAIANAARAAVNTKVEAVRAAALPLYARVDPSHATPDLNAMLDDKKAGKPMRVAMAIAWGEVARGKDRAIAQDSLEKLIKDDSPDVRAAAASAYGKVGRASQEALIKMVKNERSDVAIGAAEGLANSADAGGNPSQAVDGIAQLWKQKGKARRDAARIFARLAKKKPQAVMEYLNGAAHNPEDAGLHPIGVEGLCNAINAGYAAARAQLARVTDDPSADVRRLVMRCVADGPDPAKNAVAIAARLVKDPDAAIRAEAARVLAMSADRGGKLSGGVGDALVALVDDGDRDVRIIAVRAIAGLGKSAPAAAAGAFAHAFDRADDGEKLALLRAARAINDPDLVERAIADPSPNVRIEAVETAIATGARAAGTVSTALADADPQVRRAALASLAEHPDKLEPAAIERALALAVRDPDPELSQLALTTLAKVGAKDAVAARLGHALASRVERERAQAAAAAIGLVDRDAQMAQQLLAPLADDPSHDVRVALLPSLAAAYAKTNSPEQLAAMLDSAETDAGRRLIATAAFLILARTEAGKSAAETSLANIAKSGPPLAARSAKLALGLLASNADGIAFLQQLVP